ncbi:MAG: hypothetical protein GMKNLPBB_00530 [Myxococcota bacterium]|nr:hypothetical protein [Myxococcota bacterium]
MVYRLQKIFLIPILLFVPLAFAWWAGKKFIDYRKKNAAAESVLRASHVAELFTVEFQRSESLLLWNASEFASMFPDQPPPPVGKGAPKPATPDRRAKLNDWVRNIEKTSSLFAGIPSPVSGAETLTPSGVWLVLNDTRDVVAGESSRADLKYLAGDQLQKLLESGASQLNYGIRSITEAVSGTAAADPEGATPAKTADPSKPQQLSWWIGVVRLGGMADIGEDELYLAYLRPMTNMELFVRRMLNQEGLMYRLFLNQVPIELPGLDMKMEQSLRETIRGQTASYSGVPYLPPPLDLSDKDYWKAVDFFLHAVFNIPGGYTSSSAVELPPGATFRIPALNEPPLVVVLKAPFDREADEWINILLLVSLAVGLLLVVYFSAIMWMSNRTMLAAVDYATSSLSKALNGNLDVGPPRISFPPPFKDLALLAYRAVQRMTGDAKVRSYASPRAQDAKLADILRNIPDVSTPADQPPAAAPPTRPRTAQTIVPPANDPLGLFSSTPQTAARASSQLNALGSNPNAGRTMPPPTDDIPGTPPPPASKALDDLLGSLADPSGSRDEPIRRSADIALQDTGVRAIPAEVSHARVARQEEDGAPYEQEDGEKTRVFNAADLAAQQQASPPVRTPTSPGADAFEMHAQELFTQYMQTRAKCGEPQDLAFEKFFRSLKKQRTELMAKHNCKDVRFEVYIKDGKAALKARPVR